MSVLLLFPFKNLPAFGVPLALVVDDCTAMVRALLGGVSLGRTIGPLTLFAEVSLRGCRAFGAGTDSPAVLGFSAGTEVSVLGRIGSGALEAFIYVQHISTGAELATGPITLTSGCAPRETLF